MTCCFLLPVFNVQLHFKSNKQSNLYKQVPENVSFISSCPLYTGSNYMHLSYNEENETVLYRQ